jgi:hypothetical protein
MESQRTNGAGDEMVVDATAVEEPPAPSTQLVRRERRSEVLHPLDRAQLVASFREYQELCRELLDESDYQSYRGREKLENDLRATAATRAKNRAISDLHAAEQMGGPQPTASAASGSPPTPNPHGASGRATAGARGIADGELANLIRAAAGSARIADERAAPRLATLLERITEPIAQQTVELIDMLHPAGEHHHDEGGTVSVDFAAFDPDAAEAA